MADNGGLDININDSDLYIGQTVTFFTAVVPGNLIKLSDQNSEIGEALPLELFELFKKTPLIESKNITIKTIQ